MKYCLILALALSVTTVSTAFASEQETESKKAKPAKATQQLEAPKQKSTKEALTGSYVKSDVRRTGSITDGARNVAVVDSNMIRRSGAADLSQLLIRTGYRR
jgi:outer membrane receptor for monomeric catechols